jgi:tetratricopeptide (TPR) repeat protein
VANELILENPRDTEALILASFIAKASGDSVQKRSYNNKVLAIDPTNSDANVELGDEQMLRKNYPLARRYYLTAVRGDPKNPAALFGSGQAAYYLGELKDAEATFKIMISNNPAASIAWQYLGKLESEKSNFAKAQEYIETALKYDNAVYDYWLDYGQLLRNQSKYAEAIAAWEQASKIDPGYFLAYAYLAGIHDELENFDKSLENYRAVVRVNPAYYFAYESIGILAWHKENWEECRAAFSKAREVNAENVSYPLLIAASYFKEGKATDAKNYLAQVMRRMDRNSLEYAVVRLYFDNINDALVVKKVMDETNRTIKGKLTYYLALYYDINKAPELALQYYTEVHNIVAPMFFEYRLNDWALEKLK